MDSEVGPEPDRSSDLMVHIPLEQWIKAESAIPRQVIITFNQSIDNLLGGGVFPGKITEIFGEKGAGKTTLCMQMCITIQLPRRIQGLESEAFFIDTEQTFSRNRFKEMAEGCIQHCKLIKEFRSTLTVEGLMKGVHLVHCSTLEDLRNVVLELDNYLLSNPKVKLVVLDSLAFLHYSDPLFRRNKSWMVRTKCLYYFAQEFNRLINKYGIAILVTNNVTSRFEGSGQRFDVPFLGPSWQYIPHVRFQLQKDKEQRQVYLHKHFEALPSKRIANFEIRTAGIR